MILIIMVLTPIFVVNYIPSTNNYSLINIYWNGYSEFEAIVKPKLVISPSDLIKEPNTIYFLIPARNYTQTDTKELMEYALKGGIIVILSDKKEPANQLLKQLGVKSFFDGNIVRDPYFYDKETGLILANITETGLLSTNASTIELDHATVIRKSPQAIVIYATSPDSYLDMDGNNYFTEGEPSHSYPVVVFEPLGNGGVILISDPDIWINSMIDKAMNKQLLIDMIEGKKAYLDLTHMDMKPYEIYHLKIRIIRSWMINNGVLPLLFAFMMLYMYRYYKGVNRFDAGKKTTIPITVTSILILLFITFYYNSSNIELLSTTLILSMTSIIMGYTTVGGFIPYTVIASTTTSLTPIIVATPLLLMAFAWERKHNRKHIYHYIVYLLFYSALYNNVLTATILLALTIPFLNIISSKQASNIKVIFVQKEELFAGTKNKLLLKMENKNSLPVSLLLKIKINETIITPNTIAVDLEPNDTIIEELSLYTDYSGKKKIELTIQALDLTGLGKSITTLISNIVIEPIHELAKRLAIILLDRRTMPTRISLVGQWQPDYEYLKQIQPSSLHSGDYVGIREYIPGDDPRMVHWKKSISQMRLITIERANPSRTNMIILTDLSYTSEKDLDKQIYQTLTLLENMLITTPNALASLYIYTRKRVLYIKEKQLPEKILIDLLKKLHKIISEAQEEKKASIENEIKMSIRHPSNVFLAFYKNYSKMIKNHPINGIMARILASSKNTSSETVVTLIKQAYNLHHMYAIIKIRLRTNGYRIIEPPRVNPEKIRLLLSRLGER